MFKALLSKQLGELLTFFFAGKKKKLRSTGKSVSVILLGIFVIGVLAFMFGGMALSICVPMCMVELDWLYFTIMGLISFIFGVVGSIFTAYTGIFVAKDNELLLSMPIKPRLIVFVRMLSLYIISFVFDALVLVPAGLIYIIFGSPTITTFITYPVAVLVLPMLSLTVSCILGWIVALIAPRVKNKNLVTMVISVLFMGAYFIFCFGMGDYLEQLILNISFVADAIKGNAYILYLFGSALMGDIIPFLVFLFASLLIFGTVYFAISKTFLRLSTMKRGSAKIKYQAKEMKVSGFKAALFRRELNRFFSSTAYLLNCGIGIIMIALVAIFAVIEGGTISELITMLSSELPEIIGLVPAVIAMIMSFMMSMTVISAPSVSLEGKTIWLIQSLPVRGRDVLRSKVLVHTAMLAPISSVCSLILCIITGVSPVETVAVVLYSASTAVVGAYLGVVMNLAMPKLEFTNETVAVKQSGSVIVTMLILMGLDIVHAVLFITTFIVIPSFITVFGVAAVNIIACAVMDHYLSNGGERKFVTLG